MTASPPDVPNPPGVDLTDWDDFPKQRKEIFDSVKTSFEKKFPYSHGGVRWELHDVHYVDPEEYSLADQKKALMQDKFLHRRLRGTYKLFDEKTNEPLDERQATLLRVPYLTERGTFVHGGSDYAMIRQARLMPGIYTRRKASGEVETHFNSRRGTGPSFRVRLEPESGLFKLDIGQSSLRLYSLLKDIGVNDEELEKSWGPELLAANRQAYDKRVFEKAYQRLVRRPDPNATPADKIAAIRNALAATKLDRKVVQRTLPNLFSQTKSAAAGLLPANVVNNRTNGVASQSGGDDLNKADLQLLAYVLDQKFGAGIPLDLPTDQLVAEILEALHEQAPNFNPEMLAFMLDQHKSAGLGKLGCLMARLDPAEAVQFITWTKENVPEDQLAGSGYENEPHVTARFGFYPEASIEDLKTLLQDWGPIRLTCREVGRFEGVEGGTQDALKVAVESSDLIKLHKAINDKFGDQLLKSKFSYKPHLTLAYLTKGALKELDGHMRFDGHTFVLNELVYSTPGSKTKVKIPLLKKE